MTSSEDFRPGDKKLPQLGEQAPVSWDWARHQPASHPALGKSKCVVFSPASKHRESTGSGYQGAGAPVARDDTWGPSPPGQRVVFEYLLDMLVF